MFASLSRWLAYGVFAVGAWWLWTGPIHDARTVTPEERLQANALDMKRCLGGKNYVAGATGNGTSDPEKACARELNLYLHEGRWYSYADPRPGGAPGS